MTSRLLKFTSVIVVLSLLLTVTLGVLFFQSIPALPGRPDAPVLAMPVGGEDRGYYQAYRGVHPRFLDRPEEKFQFPIEPGGVGPIDPLFAPHNKYPFLCGRERSRPDQPMVDNQDGLGIPIYALDEDGLKTSAVKGFSKDCLYPTRVSYFYNKEGTERFYPLSQAEDDIARIEVAGRMIDFVVRLETGTINRYIYAMATLRGEGEVSTIDEPVSVNGLDDSVGDGAVRATGQYGKPQTTYWNRRLIYQFRGGVGIGKRQGDFKPKDVLERRFTELKKGYAVVYSTANQTKNHYNIWLAEDTALRVKRQFVALYGEPLYTVGIGGSGGAIQQYLFAQNNPEILDAAIPLYSYPDMVTQTIYVMDCEPLEYFFDVTDGDNSAWSDWSRRGLIEGMSADQGATNEFESLIGLASLLSGQIPRFQEGANECVKGWRGLTPLVHNPRFVHFSNSFSPDIANRVHWTHWEDLKHFYGVDEHGYANSAWDNVGVQYGLEALRKGLLSPEEFIRLNSQIGGWKPAHMMGPEKLWLLAGTFFPVDLSFWSHHNMEHSEDGGETPAKRTEGSLQAIEGAYRSGHVFVGLADIPIVDLRHYLDRDLDMHHATASFSTRLRMLKGQGDADNQVIWMTSRPHNPVPEAFAVMDQWMLNILINPDKGVVANKPPGALDKCFTDDGSIVASGDSVWDGDWNNKPTGQCMSLYPRNKTSREIAGGTISGDVFKCQLQSVTHAMVAGLYGEVDMMPHFADLERVFPSGVCDYSKPDLGLPVGNWMAPMVASRDHQEEAKGDDEAVGSEEVKSPMTISRLEVEAESLIE